MTMRCVGDGVWTNVLTRVCLQGPILTVANWSGQWPGLVGLLNLNASLTKMGIKCVVDDDVDVDDVDDVDVDV